MKAWLLRLLRNSIQLVVEEALVSARKELMEELETSTMFKEDERVQVSNVSEMLIAKVLVELDKRL